MDGNFYPVNELIWTDLATVTVNGEESLKLLCELNTQGQVKI